MSEEFIDKLIILQRKDASLTASEQKEREYTYVHLLLEESLELAWMVHKPTLMYIYMCEGR